MVISSEDFFNVEIHVGKIVAVEEFPKAKKPAYKLTIDFGTTLGIKRSSAQITERYAKQELVDKLILAVTNFPPKQIADFISEVLVLGVATDSGVVLLNVDADVPLGSRVS